MKPAVISIFILFMCSIFLYPAHPSWCTCSLCRGASTPGLTVSRTSHQSTSANRIQGIRTMWNLLQSGQGTTYEGKKMCAKCSTFIPINWPKECPRCGSSKFKSLPGNPPATVKTTDDQADPVNMDKLIEQLRKELYTELEWAKNEVNGPELWEAVSLTVIAFLNECWKQQLLLGNTMDEAFTVKCDSTTMNSDNLVTGSLVCKIGIAAVRPGKFSFFDLNMDVLPNVPEHAPDTPASTSPEQYNWEFGDPAAGNPGTPVHDYPLQEAEQKVNVNLDIHRAPCQVRLSPELELTWNRSAPEQSMVRQELRLVELLARSNGHGSKDNLSWYKRGKNLWVWKTISGGKKELLSWPGAFGSNRLQPVDFSGNPVHLGN